MIKQDFVDRVADKTGLNRVMVKSVIEAFLTELRQALSSGARVELRTFGVFSAKRYAARAGRNPKTGDPVSIPERLQIRFKPSRLLVPSRPKDGDLFSG